MNKMNKLMNAFNGMVEEVSNLLAPRSSLLAPLSHLLAPRSNLLAPTSSLHPPRSCLLASLLSVALAVTCEGTVRTALDANTHVLKDDTVYDLEVNLEIKGTNQFPSALSLESGTACINLQKGVKLTVTGKDASGGTGAGAGIRVAPNAVLFITGDGEVVATGGKAAAGCDGGRGEDAIYSTTAYCEYKDVSGKTHGAEWYGVLGAGRGGVGGAGGGGAGAGIGGAGGAGGAGGKLGKAADDVGDERKMHYYGRHNDKYYMHNGPDGGDGQNGTPGEGMGMVVITGMVRVRARGGDANSGFGKGGTNGQFVATINDGLHNLYIAVGGGGGGGGGGGCAATGVGGGGGGGGGGGAGGGGGHFIFNWWKDIKGYPTNAVQGSGSHPATWPFVAGDGAKAGEKFITSLPFLETTKYLNTQFRNGKGGNGGGQAARGGPGSVYVSLRAGLDDQDALRYAPPPALVKSGVGDIRPKITFKIEGRESVEKVCLFMGELPGMRDVPTRPGYRFAGWWTNPEKSGGESICFYDRWGTPLLPYFDQLDDIELIARWEPDPAVLTVNSNVDRPAGAEPEKGKVTLRDAVTALCDNPSLVGTNGSRRITFALPEGESTIRLNRPIVVSPTTKPFEIFGLCGVSNDVWAVTIDGGGKTRLFDLNGAGVTFSHLMFTGGKSSVAGGAIRCIGKGSSLEAVDCAFFGNSASGEGGAVYAPDGIVLLRNCTFAGNAAVSYGAVSASGGAVALNCTFSENVSSKSDTSDAAAFGMKNGLVAHCTFSRNGKSITCNTLPGDGNAARAVNCIFADGEKSTDGLTQVLYSGEAKPSEAFVDGGRPQTNVFYGVRHVWYEPRQSKDNFDAALLYYDGVLGKDVIAVKGVTTNVLYGTADNACIPILADQLRMARLAPARGSIRLLSGEDRSGVFLEGIYEAGKGQTKTFEATVAYDDGIVTTNKVSVTADNDGYFGVSIPVEGSDGTAHNAKSCRVEGLNVGDERMSIVTFPYAFTASSSTMLASGEGDGEEKDLELPGDAVTVNRVSADAVAVTGDNGYLVVGSQSFSAGTVRGFEKIALEGVDVTEGRLDVFQDQNEKKESGGLEYGKPAVMVSGLDVPLANGSQGGQERSLTIKAKKTETVKSKATGQGLLQVFVRAPAVDGNCVGLEVGNRTVTPLGGFGTDGRKRQMLWTVPVFKDDMMKLTLQAGSKDISVDYQWQYMYFGVRSASYKDDEEK